MAIRIRMMRFGKKKQPFYRIVVIDKEHPRDSRYLDLIGTYDPRSKDDDKRVCLNMEKVSYWRKCGARPSDTVSNLLRWAAKQ